MPTPWQEYKERLGQTRPWNLIDGSPRADDDVAEQRLAVCRECPHLLKATKQCKKCGCFMPAKVKLLAATCPIGSW